MVIIAEIFSDWAHVSGEVTDPVTGEKDTYGYHFTLFRMSYSDTKDLGFFEIGDDAVWLGKVSHSCKYDKITYPDVVCDRATCLFIAGIFVSKNYLLVNLISDIHSTIYHGSIKSLHHDCLHEVLMD